MSQQSLLLETLHRHTDEIYSLNKKINKTETYLDQLIREQSKLSEIIETHIKHNIEISNIKEHIKWLVENSNTVNQTLHNIETKLATKEVLEQINFKVLRALKKYFPIISVFFMSTLLLGIYINDCEIGKIFIQALLNLIYKK